MKDEESIGGQACRQHDFVDVTVLDSRAGSSMLGLAPKRLDRVAEWHVVQRYLETLLSLRAEGRVAAHAVLPHKLDSVQPNRQPEFAKGQSLLRGRLQLAALQDRRESIRCERSMLIFQ